MSRHEQRTRRVYDVYTRTNRCNSSVGHSRAICTSRANIQRDDYTYTGQHPFAPYSKCVRNVRDASGARVYDKTKNV